MSTNSQITSEPIIHVGIILPEDKKTAIRIQIPNQSKYLINNQVVSDSLEIECHNDTLFVNGNKYKDITISPTKDDPIISITVDSVLAGRGFHWQKDIKTNLPGKVIIKNHSGSLFLINELLVEQYLPYVATSEMNADCPTALLEAQTIAARSWLLTNRKVNHPDLNIDVCNDDCCQRYQGVTNVPKESLQAIHNTYGQVLQYNNEICDARYSKSCGGITESFENVWGGKPIPYLSSIPDFPQPYKQTVDLLNFINSSPPAFCSEKYVKPQEFQKYLGKVDTTDSYYRWNIEYSQEELTSIINAKLDLNVKAVKKLISLKRSFSGRITILRIDYIDQSDKNKSIILNSEYDIRNALHEQFLYSSAFVIKQESNHSKYPKSFKLTGAGWGHGVGLCQIGTLGMALEGYSSDAILIHYFKGAQINKLY